MKKKTIYLAGILLAIIIGTLLYCFLCDSCCCVYCGKTQQKVSKTHIETSEPEIVSVTRNAFAVSDDASNFEVAANDNFNFKISQFTILDSVSPNVTIAVSKLKNYLLENPLKTVTVTGFYKADEVNNSAFPNLGLARANNVKNYLVSHGIPSKQINIDGALNNEINPDHSKTLFGPLAFGILTSKADASNEALVSVCDSVRKHPIQLYFKTGEAAIALTPEQRQKIANISRCVDKLDVKVLVVGHTDNTGDAQNNMRLGQERADFAKAYLVKNGILAEHIQTASKGQTEPIADNATEVGRTKNRRTVITIN